jgi:hypothetical protein
MTFAAPMESPAPAEPAARESRWALLVFIACLAFHFWGVGVGWQSRALPGVEFRQAQTALSAYWIKAERNFELAYPTPVLGKPWSVPFEFPLFQWVVVLTSDATNWSLTKSGRAVGIACFYLALPAIFLLLARWRVPPGRRWLVLAVVVTCPLYIFYARAFLMETMALMFGLWFWVGFERGVAGRSAGWLAVAMVAGAGAGLVKVTTFILFLLPPAAWAIARLWRQRRGGWGRDLAWMAAAVALPFAATLAWLRFADATKSGNVLAATLTSGALSDFNFGTNATRWSAEMWAMKWQRIREELTWLPVVGLCAALAAVAGRVRWREYAACLAWFGSVLVIFPVLYAVHDHYYVANGIFVLLAMGLALVALAETRAPRLLVFAALLAVTGGQAVRYVRHYYPEQRLVLPGGDGLTQALRVATQPDEVIVILGQDWNSMTPYYAQRRALMFRDVWAHDPALVEAALARLDPDRIGALVIVGQPNGRQWLIDRADARGLTAAPVFQWRDAAVYVREDRRLETIHTLLDHDFPEVGLPPGTPLPMDGLAGRWRDVASLQIWQRRFFAAMTPSPVRYFSSFGPGADGSSGTLLYGAHPVTRLVFALPAGPHTLRATIDLPEDAYRDDLADAEATDGVEITLFALGPGGSREVLATRLFDPRHRREDRGPARPLEFAFTLPAAGEVELYFGPGPNGRDTRDWIRLGPVRIE